MKTDDAIDLVGYAIADAGRCHRSELTDEFTLDDVRGTIKALLQELMDDEPSDADACAVLNY